MKRSLALSAVFLVVWGSAAFAETLKDENAVKAWTDQIMAKVGAGDLDAAFNEMKSQTSASPTEVDGASMQSKAGREKFGQRWGATTGFEFIDSKKAGESLFRLRYVEKTEHHAILWIFNFYREKNAWTLNTFNWNDNYLPLFD